MSDDLYDSAAFVARREVRQLIFNLETLLEEVGDEGGITVAELRQNLLNTIADVKEQSHVPLLDSIRSRVAQARSVAVSVNDFVHGHPWMAVMMASGMGWTLRTLVPSARKP
jgi:ElaB/YqjD/DUF883 family membrane-anchored ribosome-binding protein